MTTHSDRIVNLAYAMADARVAHSEAVKAYANDQGDAEWSDIELLAAAWVKAQQAFRAAVAEGLADAFQQGVEEGHAASYYDFETSDIRLDIVRNPYRKDA